MSQNTDKKEALDDVQQWALQEIIKNQLETSQNYKEAMTTANKTAKFYAIGMTFAFLLSIVLMLGYFVFYDFNYEVIEEETISEDTYQSVGSNITNSTVEQNMTVGSE